MADDYDDPFDENDPTLQKVRSAMRDVQKNIDAKCAGPAPSLDDALWVMDKLQGIVEEPVSFRDLIYGKMGYGPEAYVPMSLIGVGNLTNAMFELHELRKLAGTRGFEEAARLVEQRQDSQRGPMDTPAVGTREHEALQAAVSAIYFADNSDYFSYLWEVVRALSGAEFADLLENDERKAYTLVSGDADN